MTNVTFRPLIDYRTEKWEIYYFREQHTLYIIDTNSYWYVSFHCFNFFQWTIYFYNQLTISTDKEFHYFHKNHSEKCPDIC